MIVGGDMPFSQGRKQAASNEHQARYHNFWLWLYDLDIRMYYRFCSEDGKEFLDRYEKWKESEADSSRPDPLTGDQ